MTHFGFEGGTLVLIESGSGHCLSFPVTPHNQYLIPPAVREATNYSLRNQHNIASPFCRAELLESRVLPRK